MMNFKTLTIANYQHTISSLAAKLLLVMTSAITAFTGTVGAYAETLAEFDHETTSQVVKFSQSTSVVYTDIVIDRSASSVWAVLTDFENMASWSSSLTGIEGDIRNGGNVNFLYNVQGKALTFPKTLIYVEGERYGYLNESSISPNVYTDHQFIVVPVSPERTRFVQIGTFTSSSNEFDLTKITPVAEGSYNEFNRELAEEVMKR